MPLSHTQYVLLKKVLHHSILFLCILNFQYLWNLEICHNLTRVNKLTIFHSFILSHFNFCPMAWHFCNKANTQKMEKVQERALWFIYEDYDSSYEQLLTRAKTPSLEIKRLRTMAIECFKIIHDLSPPCLSDLVSYKKSSYNFRYSNLLEIPHIRTTA